MALTDKLTAIADAIRSKTGKTDGLTLEQMPGEIAGIQTGGDTSQEDGLVTRTITSYSNERVTTVGDAAFTAYYALEHVSFPNVVTIGNDSFRDSGLKTFYFPKLASISSYAFRNIKVKQITAADLPSWDGTIRDYGFATNSTMEYFQHTFTKSLGSMAFMNSSGLKKVDLCTHGLYSACFSGCSKLATLILRRADAICELGNTNVLSNTPIIKGTGFVYTPRALIEEYRQATNWSSLLPEQFRAIEDYPEICEVGV